MKYFELIEYPELSVLNENSIPKSSIRKTVGFVKTELEALMWKRQNPNRTYKAIIPEFKVYVTLEDLFNDKEKNG